MNPDDLSPEEALTYVRTVLDGLAEAWVRSGRPMPPTVARARGLLNRALACAMSLGRQEIGPDSEEFSPENVGTDKVAERLGVTRRTVQRNAESLGGQRVSGTWVFPRTELGAGT